MTGDLASSGHLQLGLMLGAGGHHLRTPRMEAAARGRIQRARHFARQHDFIPPLVRMGGQRRREQRLRVGMLRGSGHLARVTDLDDATRYMTAITWLMWATAARS